MIILQPYAGYIVRVTTMRYGSSATHIPYIVAEWEPEKAEQAIRAAVSPADRVRAVLQIPSPTVDRFNLKPGEFTPFGSARSSGY